MATKAERFKADAQRAAHSKTRKTRKAPTTRDTQSTTGQAKSTAGSRAAPAGARSRRSAAKPAVPHPASHNLAPRVARNSPFEFEVSATPRPSRKSTRRSPTHLKPDSPLRITAMNKTASPKARASRRGG